MNTRGLTATGGLEVRTGGAQPSDGRATLEWTAVCRVDRLVADRGAAALVDGRAVAVFLLADGSVHAIDNVDPYSGASVLSRGIVGDVDGVATVASPMYKQRFDLRTGNCLDGPDGVRVHDVRIRDGMVEVRLAGDAVDLALAKEGD